MSGISYIATPISISLLAITIASIFLGIKGAKYINESDAEATGHKRSSVIFLGCITLYLAVAVWDASTITRFGDKVFPLTVGIVSLIACALLFVQMRFASETSSLFVDLEKDGPESTMPHKLWPTLFWFALLLGLALIFGMVIALAGFFVSFYRIRARLSWVQTLLYTALGMGGIIVFAYVLGRDFPQGLLQAYTNLPWPFT